MNAFSSFHGVRPINKDKYLASIEYRGITKRLGLFVSEKHAAVAYDNEVLRLGLENTLPLNRDLA